VFPDNPAKASHKSMKWTSCFISCKVSSDINLLQEMRRRRQEVNVELRKVRKDDQLLKRRNLSTEDESALAQQEKSQSPASMTIEEIIEGMVHNIWFVIWKVCGAH
jgi:hypothetical protein